MRSRPVEHLRTLHEANDDNAKPAYSAFSDFGGEVSAVVALDTILRKRRLSN
jgi:hypothetical protein